MMSSLHARKKKQFIQTMADRMKIMVSSNHAQMPICLSIFEKTKLMRFYAKFGLEHISILYSRISFTQGFDVSCIFSNMSRLLEHKMAKVLNYEQQIDSKDSTRIRSSNRDLFEISRILRILMEYIKKVCSLESQLFLICKCSIRILHTLEVIAQNEFFENHKLKIH